MATSYFPMYNSSSFNTATTSTNGSLLPVTPTTSHSTSKLHLKREHNAGYDSDSSEEGGRRPTPPQQGLMLRITNPDMDADTCNTPMNAAVATNNVPALPPHINNLNRATTHNSLPHLVSKTLAVSTQETQTRDKNDEVTVIIASCSIQLSSAYICIYSHQLSLISR